MVKLSGPHVRRVLSTPFARPSEETHRLLQQVAPRMAGRCGGCVHVDNRWHVLAQSSLGGNPQETCMQRRTAIAGTRCEIGRIRSGALAIRVHRDDEARLLAKTKVTRERRPVGLSPAPTGVSTALTPSPRNNARTSLPPVKVRQASCSAKPISSFIPIRISINRQHHPRRIHRHRTVSAFAILRNSRLVKCGGMASSRSRSAGPAVVTSAADGRRMNSSQVRPHRRCAVRLA